uniref:Uncharacterized protein n=1 Tax=Anopheles coluzzii TaxID=1518534 RepID=A0A8W7P532_ANOCL
MVVNTVVTTITANMQNTTDQIHTMATEGTARNAIMDINMERIMLRDITITIMIMVTRTDRITAIRMGTDTRGNVITL